MNISRIATKLILATVLLVAVIVILFALFSPALEAEISWAVIAAALAVIASVVGAWTAQRALEIQQDTQQPYPYPTVDTLSRYSVLQLCVKNAGGTTGHDIQLEWDEPILDSKGKPVVFVDMEGAPDIPVLLPGESVSVLIDENSHFFSNTTNANYSGYIRFKDVSGNKRGHRFHLSIEQYRRSLHYEREDPKTHYRLQELPSKLDKVADELQKLRKDNSFDE